MLGRTHALSGAVAYTAIAPLAHTPVQIAAGAACTAGAALLPDLDHPSASATRALGPITQAIGWAVRTASGGHRHGTHSLTGVAVFTAAAWACSLTPYAAMAALWLLAALAVRAFRRRDPILECLIIAAAAAVERWLIVPALALGLVLLLWRAAGTDLIHSISSFALTGATP